MGSSFLSAEHNGKSDSVHKSNILVYPFESVLQYHDTFYWDYFVSLPPGCNITKTLTMISFSRHRGVGNAIYRSFDECSLVPRISPICGYVGSTPNYYHYVYDVLPRLLVLLKSDSSLSKISLVVDEQSAFQLDSFQNQWLRILGVDFSRLVVIHPRRPSIFNNLICPLVRKDHLIGDSHGSKYQYIKLLREQVLNCHVSLRSQVNDGCFDYVFVSRSARQSKRINWPNLVDAIAQQQGYTVVYLEEMTIISQLTVFASCKVLVGLGGAGMANALFCDLKTIIRQIGHTSSWMPVNPKTMGWSKASRPSLNRNDFHYYGRYLQLLGYDYSSVCLSEDEYLFSFQFKDLLVTLKK